MGTQWWQPPTMDCTHRPHHGTIHGWWESLWRNTHHPAPSHPSQIASGLCYLGWGKALGWVWGSHCSAGVSCCGFQTAGQSGEQELENLVLKLSVLKDFLSSIEKKVRLEMQGWMA